MMSASPSPAKFYLVFLAMFGFASFANAQSCRRDRDCPRGYICLEAYSGKGVCVVDNNRECSSNGDCPTGWTCINNTCSKGGSGQSCTGNGDCDTGYVCCNHRCKSSNCLNHQGAMGVEEFESDKISVNFPDPSESGGR